jgi:hypothetical protein
VIEFRIGLPNEPGKLAELGDALAENKVNVRSLAGIGSASPFIAFVVDQDDLMRSSLQRLSLPFEEIELLAIELPDQAGELANFAGKLREANVNVDSIYVLNKNAGRAEIGFTEDKVTDAKLMLNL